MMFTWLNKIVFKAYCVPHLPIEELPPLADYDQAHNLVQKSLKVRALQGYSLRLDRMRAAGTRSFPSREGPTRRLGTSESLS